MRCNGFSGDVRRAADSTAVVILRDRRSGAGRQTGSVLGTETGQTVQRRCERRGLAHHRCELRRAATFDAARPSLGPAAVVQRANPADWWCGQRAADVDAALAGDGARGSDLVRRGVDSEWTACGPGLAWSRRHDPGARPGG